MSSASRPLGEQRSQTLRGVLVDAAVVLGLFAVAGVVAGLLWPHLGSPAEVVRTDQGLLTSEPELGRLFDRDGWYAVVAAVLGLVLGLVAAAWRRTNELATVLLVVTGAALAAFLMVVVGGGVGPADPQSVLASAPVGTTAPSQAVVRAHGVLYLWPVAALVGVLLVYWGGSPRQRADDQGPPQDEDSSSFVPLP